MDEEQWRETMTTLLDSTRPKGSVSTSHEVQMPGLLPRIVVDGLPPGEDRLAFPLAKHQALALIRSTVSEKAPFGKGRNTVLDETVRKAWQIDAQRVLFPESNRDWTTKLRQIAQTCAEKLGLSDSQKRRMRPILYKMLLYETGGHFSRHRDTEKEPGMFATMVVQLPSRYTGGGLVVHHGGIATKHDWSARSDDGFFATAFFADCEHELLEVTSGYRLCLVYNLVLRKSTGILPSAAGVSSLHRELRFMARSMDYTRLDPWQGYLLEHQYTKTNLHFRNLKGRDLEIASLLQNAVDENGEQLFVVCLLLLEKWETGPAEGGYSYGRYGGDEPYSMCEVFDSSVSPKHWVGPDDSRLKNFRLEFDLEDNLLTNEPYECIFNDDPDKQDVEAYTGNAGPTLEYWYWKSVVVFWPRTKQKKIVKQAGPSSLEWAYANHLVSMLEESGTRKITAELIRSIARSKDERLMVRVFRQITCGIPRDNVAVQIVKALKFCSSNDSKQSLLNMLKRVSNMDQPARQKNATTELKRGSSFLFELENVGLDHLVSPAKEAILGSAVEHLDSIVRASSTDDIGQLAGIFIDEPAVLKRIADIVVTMATFVRPTLNRLMSLEPEPGFNDAIAGLAEVRMQQLLCDTRSGPPTFSWCQTHSRDFTGSQSEKVNAFLRGPNQTHTFDGFNGIEDAREWAAKFRGLNVNASPSGNANNAYVVVVTKTRAHFEAAQQRYNEQKAELTDLQEEFGASKAAPKRTAVCSQDASKKQKSTGEVMKLEQPLQVVTENRTTKTMTGSENDPISV